MFLSEIGTEEEKNRFTVLYYARRQEMYTLAFGVLNDAQLAEDAVQEAFMYIARNIDKIDDPVSEKTRAYVNLTAVSRARSILRGRKELPVETLQQAGAVAGAEASFFKRIERAELVQAIEALPEHYRAPVLLFYGQDLPVEAIARILDISPETVRKRLQRAREKLRAALTENGEATE